MPESWLTFGLSAEQEDRFRQTHLGADIAQARICILLVVAPLVGFAVNDYGFFGLSRTFYGLAALRLALLVYTALLLRGLRGLTSYRAYDRAEFVWGLCVALFAVGVSATRPQAFVSHTTVAVVGAFVTVLAIPNRFVNQLIVFFAYALGETLVLVPGLWNAQPASVTALLSLWLANSIALACAWQLHCWRRREFLARAEEQRARTEAERQLAERRQAEEALRQSEEEFRAFFNTVTVATAELGLDGRFLRVNERLSQITGYSREELLRMTPAELTHPEDRQREDPVLSAFLAGHSPAHCH